jgi:hypothetical protein
MKSKEYVVVSDADKNIAGATVYWSLTGVVDLQDILEACEQEGIPEERWPDEPSLELVVSRAADHVASSLSVPGDRSRFVVLPVGRRTGVWEVHQQVQVPLDDEGKKQTIKDEKMVRVEVVKNGNGMKKANVSAYHDGDAVMMVEQIREAIPKFQGLLLSVDISGWLLEMLDKYVDAVSLRRSGGFYFVPQDRMERWQAIDRIIQAVSQHRLEELPTIKTDRVIETILGAFRREVEETMKKEVEEYLEGGEFSTRGLNAIEEKLAELEERTKHYASFLGVALPDLEEKAVMLRGAAAAARIVKKDADK